MIDNLHIFKKDILEFKKQGDFFYLMIVVRKKDMTTDKSNHQSVRVIKSYSIYSLEYLENKYDEIKAIAEIFKARVYLGVNRLNDSQVSLKMLKELVDNLESGNNNCRSLWDSVVGKLVSQDKRWVVDIDAEELEYLEGIKETIYELDPCGNKIITTIPTISGIHLITKPFRVDHFENWCKTIPIKCDIQKKNPSLLFVPDSLLEFKKQNELKI